MNVLQYLYFLRFSIVIWASFPIFVILDSRNVTTNFTRVMVTLVTFYQFFYVALFVVISGWIALLSARLVCAYGVERFGINPPALFSVDRNNPMSRWAIVLAQLPGLVLLAYVGISSRNEGASVPWILGSTMAGIISAALLWYFFAFLYYYFHDQPTAGQPLVEFILPYRFGILFKPFRWAIQQPRPRLADTVDVLFNLGAGFPFLRAGYRANGSRELYSGHKAALILLFLVMLLYASLAYITFPLPINTRIAIQSALHLDIPAVLFVIAAFIFLGVSIANRQRKFLAYLTGCLAVISFVAWIAIAHQLNFPVLASIVLLLTIICWSGAGLAFIADPYRVPVFAIVSLWVLVLHLMPFSQDHVYELRQPRSQQGVDDHSIEPAAIVQHAMVSDDHLLHPSSPLIVVTATGGGIHSAVWTTTVLQGLEKAFKDQGLSFHSSILVMSSASGGSVGTMYWSREYLGAGQFAAAPLPTEDHEGDITARPRLSASCSSLEAVAWGLVYPDFLHAFFPIGDTIYDRGWALQQALERNAQHYQGCQSADEKMAGPDFEPTLRDLSKALQEGRAPAISFNSTVSETGERFRFSNYSIPVTPARLLDDETHTLNAVTSPFETPAKSFYSQYGDRDVSLSTAARLSATFPYVSPMARADAGTGHPTYHLADGGYYDNDGIASAAEFLWYGFSRDVASGNKKKEVSSEEKTEPLSILWIEIRDSALPETSEAPPAEEKRVVDGTKWGTGEQLVAPLGTVLNAWNGGQTTRNHREILLLQHAFATNIINVKIYPVVFPFDPSKAVPGTATNEGDCSQANPSGSYSHRTLGWYLTKCDQAEIANTWLLQQSNAASIATWFGTKRKTNK